LFLSDLLAFETKNADGFIIPWVGPSPKEDWGTLRSPCCEEWMTTVLWAIRLLKPDTTLEYKAVAIRERSSQRGEFCLTELNGSSHTNKRRYETAVLPDFSRDVSRVLFKRSCNATLETENC